MNKLSYISYQTFVDYLNDKHLYSGEYTSFVLEDLYGYGTEKIQLFNEITNEKVYVEYSFPSDKKMKELFLYKHYLLSYKYNWFNRSSPYIYFISTNANDLLDCIYAFILHSINSKLCLLKGKEAYRKPNYLVPFVFKKNDRVFIKSDFYNKREKARKLCDKGIKAKKEKKKIKYLMASCELGYGEAYCRLGYVYYYSGQENLAFKYHNIAASAPFYDKDSIEWLIKHSNNIKDKIKYYQLLISISEYGEEIYDFIKFIDEEFKGNKISENESKELILKSVATIFDRLYDIEYIHQYGSSIYSNDIRILLVKVRKWFAKWLMENFKQNHATLLAASLTKHLFLNGEESTFLRPSQVEMELREFYTNQLNEVEKNITSRVEKDFEEIKKMLKPYLDKAKNGKLEQERLEKARLEKERKEKEKILEQERKERERVEQQRKEKEELVTRIKSFYIYQPKCNKPFKYTFDEWYDKIEWGYKRGIALANEHPNSLREKSISELKNLLEKIIQCMENATEKGSFRAPLALSFYYSTFDKEKCLKYLFFALRGKKLFEKPDFMDHINIPLNFEEIIEYIESEDEDKKIVGEKALFRLVRNKLDEEKFDKLISLALSGNVTALKVMTKYGLFYKFDLYNQIRFLYIEKEWDEDTAEQILIDMEGVNIEDEPLYIKFLHNQNVKTLPKGCIVVASILMDKELSNKLGFEYNFEEGRKLLNLNRANLPKELVDQIVSLCLKEKPIEATKSVSNKIGNLETTEIKVPSKTPRPKNSSSKSKTSKKSELEIAYEETLKELTPWIDKCKSQASNLMKKYPCPELDKMLERGSYMAEKIVDKYGTRPLKEAETNIQWRDAYLLVGFSISEIYDSSGYFIGHDLKDKYIAKRKIYLENLEKERLKKERLEKERLEKLKAEQERLEQIKKEKEINKTIKSTTVSKINTTSIKSKETFTLPYKAGITEDMYARFYKDLLPFNCCNRSIMDECVKVAKLRVAYNYPICPTKAGISQRKFEKLYDEYKQDIERYIERLCDIKNPIIGRENEYRMKVHGYSSSHDFINLTEFYEKIKKLDFHIKTIKTSKVEIMGSERTTFGRDTQIEKMLCLLPLYAKKIVVDIYVEMFYETVHSNEYLDWVEAFENSEYSKIMTWEEFSSTNSGYHGDIYLSALKDGNAQSNANAKTQLEKEKLLRFKIIELFKKHKVFYNHKYKVKDKTAYIEALVQTIELNIHLYEKK